MLKLSLQHLATAFMHQAGGRANVGVGIGGDVLLDEIDEAGLALQAGRGVAGRRRARLP
jgi:hypothetical protein